MAVEILWTTVFIDMGAEVFEQGAEFWCAATGSTRSEQRGNSGEFATLIPADGDSYVHVQRTDDGSNGIHLDLHVDAVDRAKDQAVALGASVVADHGYFIMRSPGGFLFCFVSHGGEPVVPSPAGDPLRRLDQLCIDVPPELFDAECAFWAALTGWELVQSSLPEYRSFSQPAGLPIRFLLQRRDAAPSGAAVHAHLDVACGDHIGAVVEQHVAIGAAQLGQTKVWMQMQDPAGLKYCLTPR